MTERGNFLAGFYDNATSNMAQSSFFSSTSLPHFNFESVLGKNFGVGPMYDGQSPQGICLLTA